MYRYRYLCKYSSVYKHKSFDKATDIAMLIEYDSTSLF